MEVFIAGESNTDRAHRLRVSTQGGRFTLLFDYRRLLRRNRLYRVYGERLGVLLDVLSRTGIDVAGLRAEISDGEDSDEGVVGFCSPHPGAILIPDPDFYRSRGYAAYRRPVPSWAGRDGTIVWRGVTTGRGTIATDGMMSDDSRLIQRSRLCLVLRDVRGADARLTNVVQSSDASRDLGRLRSAGILGEPISGESWAQRKFALDIDGNTNAWSNLFTRLLLGCCVIKVGSLRGYRQWYYHALRPFEHFVPVAADLSDLVEKIEWCRAHEGECEKIAAAGRALALTLGYEREMAAAAEAISSSYGAAFLHRSASP
jgi:hypothetical protein